MNSTIELQKVKRPTIGVIINEEIRSSKKVTVKKGTAGMMAIEDLIAYGVDRWIKQRKRIVVHFGNKKHYILNVHVKLIDNSPQEAIHKAESYLSFEKLLIFYTVLQGSSENQIENKIENMAMRCLAHLVNQAEGFLWINIELPEDAYKFFKYTVDTFNDSGVKVEYNIHHIDSSYCIIQMGYLTFLIREKTED